MSKYKKNYFNGILLTLGLVIANLALGVIGYSVIENFSFIDSLYMTAITITTVGFQEVKPLSEGGKIFTISLIITSFGTFAYAISTITKYVVGGELNNFYKHLKVNNSIHKLRNHTIICGYGRNGKQAAQVLSAHAQPFVIIEKDEERVNQIRHDGWLCIDGDCTQDDILLKAEILNSGALISTLPVDADNLFVVLSARNLNNKLTIISRASDESSDKKLKIAGADNVIMPERIGGAQMASLVIRPDVLEFWDHVTSQVDIKVNLEEIIIQHLPNSAITFTIKELEKLNQTNAKIIGHKSPKGEYTVNPTAETTLIKGDKLFVLGSPADVLEIKKKLV